MSADCRVNDNIYKWCRVCLVSNVRMCSIENSKLLEIYEKLTNTWPNDAYGIPQAICYICHSQLQRARRFSDLAHRSQKILEDMHRQGVEPHKMEIVPTAFNLSINNVSTTSIPNLNNGNCLPKADITVKDSTMCEVENNEFHPKLEKYDIASDNFTNTAKTASNDDVKCDTVCKVEIKMETKTDDDDSEDGTSPVPEEIEKIEIFIDPLHAISTNEHSNNESFSTKPKQQIVCNVCNKEFKKNCTLQTHLRTHTGEKPYVCNFCNKAFSDKGSLRKHIKMHTGEKPHECHLCHRTFTRKYNLQCHSRIHTKEKIHECNWCHKSFTHAQTLQSHIRIHTGEKPFECNMCPRTFTQRISLQSHIRTHTGEKPYICSVCNKAFAAKGNLQNHLRIHTGEKPHVCYICSKAFTEKSNLQHHLKIHTAKNSN